jgi:L-2-hydroxyglutarate oxidase LhgO
MVEPLEVDTVVIGAGVVGLAVARELALAGKEVLVLEAEARPGTHASSRNSEVIHAGIYYRAGSLKAKLCVAGRDELYRYCAARGVAHSRIGKLLVAGSDDEVPALEKLKHQAEGNGVMDLTWLDAAELARLEPNVRAVRGLLSPSTGIIDSHGLLTALKSDAEAAGAQIAFRSRVRSGALLGPNQFSLDVGEDEVTRIACRTLVNAAGLYAPSLARTLDGFPPALVPQGGLAKGHYFTLSGAAPFRHLVYPMPEPGGLGIHVTLDLGGQVRFGPDVTWVSEVDYDFDSSRKERFVQAIRRYFPALEPDRLQPGYTGIRAKLEPSATAFSDFVVQGPNRHGLNGLVHLFGIESPGLTASLALARCVLAELSLTSPA